MAPHQERLISSNTPQNSISYELTKERYKELYDLGTKRTASAIHSGYYAPTVARFGSDAHNDARAFIAEVLCFEVLSRGVSNRPLSEGVIRDTTNARGQELRNQEVRDQQEEAPIVGRGPDAGYDFKVGGITFDVKFTEHENGRLLFQSIRKFKADAAMLVTGTKDPCRMIVVGGIMRERWYKEVCTMSLGNREGRIAWVVDQKKLTPPGRIIEWLIAREARRS